MATQNVIQEETGPNLILRILWMLFVGWWLSGIFYIVGAILTLLIVTAPLGMIVIQKIGWAFSLYQESKYQTGYTASGQAIQIEKQNANFIIRFLYFLFFGWWVGGIALVVSWIAGITIIGLPLTFYINNRLGKIMTLAS